jgi:hypothetical protein
MTLYERLAPVASEMRARAWSLAKAIWSLEGGHLSKDDFVALSESAAFLAYTSAGGDVDDPDSFDWDTKGPGLVRLGLSFFRTDLGINQEDAAIRRAHLVRKDGHCVDELAWDLWSLTDAPQESAFRDSMLAQLEPLIAERLGAQTARLVCDHYFRGVPQRELALALVAQGMTHTKAEQVVNKAMSRARQKLRTMLPPEWVAVTREVA